MTRTALIPTLIDSRSAAKQAALILGGAALTALSAQATIPWIPVPFTLQTLAVTLCGITLGRRMGAMTQVTYLAAGACGLPVFAEGALGFQHLFGRTGGYLWSFVIAAALLGWLAERGWDRRFWKTAVALSLANLFILTMGTLWLSAFLGLSVAFGAGFVPFVSGAVLKSAVVVAAMPLGWKLAGKDKV